MAQNIFRSLGLTPELADIAEAESRTPAAAGGGSAELTIEDVTWTSSGPSTVPDSNVLIGFIQTNSGTSVLPDGETQGQYKQFKVVSVGGGSPHHTISGKVSNTTTGDLGQGFDIASAHNSTWYWDVVSDRWILVFGTASIDFPS